MAARSIPEIRNPPFPDRDRVSPVYLDADGQPAFGFVHLPIHEASTGTVVVIVGPWGWDDIVTYRSRRDWAASLAVAGHVAIRIDLPGTGDSAGSDSDPGRVAAWASAVRAAVAYGRGLEGSRRVAVIGMGIGALLAGRAIADGAAVDDVILWAAPASGRSWIREMRAFASLQSERFSLAGEPEPRLLPEGWLEVGGYVLSAETLAELASLDPAAWSFPGVQRALLLDRDGLTTNGGFARHLQAAAIEVTVESGPGWADMCADLERHQPPLQVFERVARFLDATVTSSPIGPDLPPAARAVLSIGAPNVTETALFLEDHDVRVFAVIAQPEEPDPSGVVAIFLNAGAVRRIGPNRLWVGAARRWAARGIPSLRLDLDGIGDSDGDPTVFRDVNTFYRSGLETRITAAMDAMVRRGLGHRFVLIGLCSGAYWAFRVALEDDRVVAIAAVNPRTLVWDPHVFTRLAARDAKKVLTRASWGRFVRGQITIGRLVSVAKAVGIRVADAVRPRLARLVGTDDSGRPESMESALSRLTRRGTSMVLAFSNEESLRGYLEDRRVLPDLGRWPNATFIPLPGRDHTVRPIVAQRAADGAIDRALERAIAAVPVRLDAPNAEVHAVAHPSSHTP